MLFYSAQVINGIHGCVSAHARHEFMAQWNAIANGHPWKYSAKMFDISCNVLHDVWPPKGVIFAQYLLQNTSKNLEIVCQCEYASPDNLWQLMGTAWNEVCHLPCAHVLCFSPGMAHILFWQYRHIWLGYALRRYFMTNLVRICIHFRDFKLIVGCIIDLIAVHYFYQWTNGSSDQ